MVLLDNDNFLSQLTLLLNKSRSTGSVWITMKRYTGQTKPKSKKQKKFEKSNIPESEGESRCLFRATNGKKKLSTVVGAKDVNRFQMAYTNVLKISMDSLKKRDRKGNKSKKTKATQ